MLGQTHQYIHVSTYPIGFFLRAPNYFLMESVHLPVTEQIIGLEQIGTKQTM